MEISVDWFYLTLVLLLFYCCYRILVYELLQLSGIGFVV